MKRVLIIGSGGAGKSTLARRLGEATGIEVIHLDKLYWKPNWVEMPKAEMREIITELLKGDEWIIDGNFGSTMELRIAACDTVIFLDMPRIVCIYHILKRVLKYRNTTRPDMGEGCAEKFDLKFLGWVWNFPKTTKPQIEERLKRFERDKTIIRLRSKRDVEDFFARIESN